MKVVNQSVNCMYDSSIDGSSARDNQEDTGFLLVALSTDDLNVDAPVPRVKLAVAAGDVVYGVLTNVNTATGRCTVVTDGIVPIRANTAAGATDIGKGVVGAAGGRAGFVAALKGKGSIVSRSGNKVYVDLQYQQNVATA